MAIIDENDPLLNSIRGKIGNFVIRRVHGKSILCKRPEKRSVSNDRQISIQNRFALASTYAKANVRNAELKKLYETGITDKKRNAYMVALTDFLTVPKIHQIDDSEYRGSIGDSIIIEASDDFKVVSVEVKIVTVEGIEIESGNADRIESSKKYWRYVATKRNASLSGSKVAVSVTDFAGNVTIRRHVFGH